MTAKQLADRLSALGVSVTVGESGGPAFTVAGRPMPAAVRARVKELTARMTPAVRSELLELFRWPLWEPGWAVRRMVAADGEVERCGGVGLVPEIQAAAEQAAACWRERDRGGLDEWCGRVEDLARENRRKTPCESK